ncbi:MAG: hypothetical protein II826_06920 [Prevotella sp.]|nr:hypothetical protein [Prevotella sp.]
MKKIFTVVLLASVAIAARSQQSNPQLRQLEQFIQEQGYAVSHTQSTGTERGIAHQWSALLSAYIIHPQSAIDSTMSEAALRRIVHQYDSINHLRRQRLTQVLDSIRTTFARLGKDASESYLYEYHKGGTDTIKYSLAFRRDDGALRTYRYNNSVYFNNAGEVALFDYTRRDDSDGWGATDWGYYSHLYTIGNDISWDDMQPFDHAAFEALIAPALKAAKKLKGAKAYPVYWRHDEGFNDDVGPNGNLVGKTVRQSDYGPNSHYGLTTGTLYFIPIQHEAEAKALYRQIDSLAHSYVDSHPEQYYTYTFSSDFRYGNLRDMLRGQDMKGDASYDLKALADDTGFYILSINTKGELWIPRDWPRLKSYINGEMVYQKSMKPKEKK